jgi:hypothetical protein
MITSSDSFYTYDLGKYYVIIPSQHTWDLDSYIEYFDAKKVELGFRYNSGENDSWVSVEEIRDLIKNHVDPDFSV